MAALNPIYCITLATRIGASYLLMCLFLLLLLFAPTFLIHYIGAFMPKKLLLFVSYVSVLYYTVISYNLMGYVILQYHEEIGYQVEADEYVEQGEAFKGETSPGKADRESAENVIGRAETLIKSGRTDDALFVMQHWLRTKGPEKTVSERYYNLLKITQKTPEMLSYAKAHLDVLTAADDKGAACAVYKECVAADPGFEPDPAALFKIGQWQLAGGDARSGAEILLRFLRVYKEHQLAPKACFVLARGFHERLKDPTRARKALGLLIQRYPGHDLTAHAQKYLAELNNQKVREA